MARCYPRPAAAGARLRDSAYPLSVYVEVFVNETYSRSLSDKALSEINSYGTDPANWQQPYFAY